MAHPGYESIKNVEEDESDYSQEEDEEEEEEEPKVSTLELFSDLVIVVSIHVVAEPLEDDRIAARALVQHDEMVALAVGGARRALSRVWARIEDGLLVEVINLMSNARMAK